MYLHVRRRELDAAVSLLNRTAMGAPNRRPSIRSMKSMNQWRRRKSPSVEHLRPTDWCRSTAPFDFLVLYLPQLLIGQFAGPIWRPRIEQTLRTQQAADDVGFEGRRGHFHLYFRYCCSLMLAALITAAPAVDLFLHVLAVFSTEPPKISADSFFR